MFGLEIASIFGGVFLLSDHHLNAPHTWNNADEVLEEALQRRLRYGQFRRRVAFLLFGLAAGTVLLLNAVDIHRFKLSLLSVAYAGWLAWSTISVLWSQSPLLSIRRLIPWLITCLASFMIGWIAGVQNLAEAFALATGLFLLVGISNELRDGSLFKRIHYRFAGTLHPNQQALNCAVLAGSVYFLMRLNIVSVVLGDLVLLAAVAGLFLTGSRSGFWASVCAATAWLALRQMRAPDWMSAMEGLGGIFLFGLAAAGVQKLMGRLQTSSKTGFPFERFLELRDRNTDKITMTGRLTLWRKQLSDIRFRIFFGAGFGAYWDAERARNIKGCTGWRFADSHSIYLETATGTGIVGCSLLLLAIAAAFSRGLWMPTVDEPFTSSFLVFYVVQGTFESAFVQPGFPAAAAGALFGASARQI